MSNQSIVQESYNPFVDKEIAAYLRINGLTQADLAEKLGMSENSLSWKRRGIREFKSSEITALANLIGFSLDEAFDIFSKQGDINGFSESMITNAIPAISGAGK